MSAAPDLQIWVYPEEIPLAGPVALARLVADLGFDGLSVALSYHQCQRVLPRYGVVRPGAAGGLQFRPDRDRYATLAPVPAPNAVGEDAIRALRRACDDVGIAFRVWLVVLDNEQLAGAHPEEAAQTLDGTPTLHALCPSRSSVRRYAAALVADVVDRFRPDALDLEASIYPRWNGYVAEIALDPTAPRLRRFTAQCVCGACSSLFEREGVDVAEAEAALRAAAGLPVGAVAEAIDGAATLAKIAAARDSGAARLLADVAGAAGDARLQLLAFGEPLDLMMQGLGSHVAQMVDTVLIGLGDAGGAALGAALDLHLENRDPVRTAIGLNWTPARSGEAFSRDVADAVARGIAGLSMYNLSLLPTRGVEEVRAAMALLGAATTT
ncbi:MAG: hypothetical protein QOE69_2816 [Thermoleophilaceae bacterium]|jgi:hypothetical protein|nr:hypothetical protein [Thermoleophilaceae bacterium]